MPILVQADPVAPPAELPGESSCWVDFRALDGSDLIAWGREDGYVIGSGIVGFDGVPVEVSRRRTPGIDGGYIDQVVGLERDLLVPVWLRSSACHGVHVAMSRMRSMWSRHAGRDYRTLDGTFVLAAGEAGSTGRTLPVVYVSGAEGDGHEPGYRVLPLRLLAVAPYWRGEQWSTPTVTQPSTAPFTSTSAGDPWPRPIASSYALGSALGVTIPGDAPSAPVVELVGPFNSVHVTSPQGLDVSIGQIAAGSTFVLDTGRHRRYHLDGVARPDLIGSGPVWSPLLPGVASITIAVSGAAAGSSARVYGTSLWESPW